MTNHRHADGGSNPVAAVKARLLTSKARLLTSVEAATFLNLKPQTLAVWRTTNRYTLPYIRVGNAIRYRQSDLDAWLASRTVGGERAGTCAGQAGETSDP
jgi:hypothetical protein